MITSKTKQIILNERRKIQVKIQHKQNDIRKLEADLKELDKDLDKLN
jgi:peptidoglycan hydrolase CwlO-like protein